MVRTLLMPPLNSSACSYSGARGSTRVEDVNPRGARSSRSSYSSYSSSSRPRYTMVFFMNEGAIPSPVTAQRSGCSAARSWLAAPLVAPSFGSPGGRPCRRPLPEERPADPNHGRARRHRRLEVVAHAHRPLFEPHVVGQPRHLPERRLGGGPTRWRHGHEPHDVQV